MEHISTWDPLKSTDWDKQTVCPHTYQRIKRDLASLYSDPVPGVFAVPQEDDITRIHAMITGSFDTPYEGGFFYFVIRCSPEYPIRSPRIKMMTTCNGTVRFNPNIYKNGKICLSILGTWPGPSWSPALNLSAILLSIQSLMNDKPFHNEPGYGKNAPNIDPQNVIRYNEIIQHETIRVAVCDMLENANSDSKDCPKALRQAMEKSFVEFYPHYEEVVTKRCWMTGQKMMDPFGEERGHYDYNSLLRRLQALKEKYKVSVWSDSESSDLDETK